MSVNEGKSSTVADKTVGDRTAAEAPMSDRPAGGGDGKGDKRDKDVQGEPAGHVAEPEGGDGEKGKDNTAGEAPMEEVSTEEMEEEPKTRAPHVQTFFVISTNKSKMTAGQKGQLVKGMVNEVLEAKELMAEPVAVNILDGEEHVGTMMLSMKDLRTRLVVVTLQLIGIRTTSGEFEIMGSGFILPKGYKWNEILRFLYNNLPEGEVVVMAKIGLYKMGGNVASTLPRTS